MARAEQTGCSGKSCIRRAGQGNESSLCQFDDVRRLGARGRLPARLCDAYGLPFLHHRQFKLLDLAKKVYHQRTGWRRSITRHVENAQMNAFRLQRRD
jgi:hypothetical protein